jgi:hypothetical protein
LLVDGRIREPDKKITDPDPGGPKTYGSGYGSGSRFGVTFIHLRFLDLSGKLV